MSAIRPAHDADVDWILALSARHEAETSPLDADKLRAMIAASWCTQVFDDRGGYLIVFDETGAYDSVNFRWFQARYAKFLYIDRIVVAETARGQGRARSFYEDLFEHGRRAGCALACCEVNVAPPNPASDAFHARLGFAEAGLGDLGAGKIVRYLTRTFD